MSDKHDEPDFEDASIRQLVAAFVFAGSLLVVRYGWRKTIRALWMWVREEHT